MRLSEAIRLGATMGPQVFGQSHNGGGGMCAGFGAMKAAGYGSSMDEPEAPEFLRRVFPIWYESAIYPGKEWERIWMLTVTPDGIERVQNRAFRSNIGSIIIALNDWDRWSLERIADWVEQEELRLGEIKPIEREATDLVETMVDEVLVYAPQ